MKDRLIRVILGSLTVTLLAAIVYGWIYIHTLFGLTVMFYFGSLAIFIGYYMVYAIGDIAMAAYETYKSKNDVDKK